MTSLPLRSYRRACAEYIAAALLRPRMYFASLPHLEATMGGHATAFSQLGLIDRDESFNQAFAAWLHRETGASAAAGWAHALTDLTESSGVDAEVIFADRVREFLRGWCETDRGQDSAMPVKTWALPIGAEWHRATELDAVSFGRNGLTLMLIEEDSEKRWRLHFSEVQAFKCVTEESAASLLGALPASGAFYEVDDSPWLRELGQGRLEYMSEARHYVICCYDEIVEVVATRYTVEHG